MVEIAYHCEQQMLFFACWSMKEYSYSMKARALEWFKHYLAHRKQVVWYNDTMSNKRQITYAVPQGSIYHFYLYNDSRNNHKNIFCDFCTWHKSICSRKKPTWSNINCWFMCHKDLIKKLSLNIGKTHYIVFPNKNKPRHIVLIKIDNHEIEQTLYTQFIWVIIDSNICRNKLIQHVCNKFCIHIMHQSFVSTQDLDIMLT